MMSDSKNKDAKRKLIVITFLTLDGVMQAPGGADEDPEGGFQYGGWQMSFTAGGENPMLENLRRAGALLLGRKTYDIFAAYWPTIGRNMEWYGPLMNNVQKYVASTTLSKVEWENSSLLAGDTAEAVIRKKHEAGKDIYVLGSGTLVQTLMHRALSTSMY